MEWQRLIGDSVTVCNSYSNSIYEKNGTDNSALINKKEQGKETKYDHLDLDNESYPPIHYTEESTLNDDVKIVSCFLTDEEGRIVTECEVSKVYSVNLFFKSQKQIDQCIAGFVLESKKGTMDD